MTPTLAVLPLIFWSSFAASGFMGSTPLSVPADRIFEALAEGGLWGVAHQAPGLGDVGQRMEDVAGPGRRVHGLDPRAQDIVHRREQAVDRGPRAAGDVHG